MLKKKYLIASTLCIYPLFAVLSLPLLVVFSTTPAIAAQAASVPLQYVALGDSLPFGYQPDNDFTHGYASDLYQSLQTQRGYATLVNLSCSDESSVSFINGDPNNSQRGCLVPQVQSSNQLSAAVAYLQQNASQVGVVTLQIGVDDFLNSGVINFTNCAINSATFNAELGAVDQNLAQTILPQLKQALNGAPAHQAHLTLVDYYNPLQQLCPNTTSYIEAINEHLKDDARGYASFVDISRLFNETNMCQLTWMCNDNPPTLGDIHPNNQGYAMIGDEIYHHIFG